MNRYARMRILAVTLVLAGSLGLVARPVAAHAHVTVGEYELIVGWRTEPAVAGYPNGLDLEILNGTKTPVVGAERTLNATITTGPASATKPLEPEFGQNGSYTFDVIPTRPGAYSVRIVGRLGTTAVNVLVPLDEVAAASDPLTFPDSDPQWKLQDQVKAANALIVGLESQLALALGIAVLGVIVGVAGIAAAWRMSRIRQKVQ